MYNVLQRRRRKQKKAMNAPHVDVRPSTSSGNGAACGPTTEIPTVTLAALQRRDRTADAWTILRHNGTGSPTADDRLSSRWFMPFVQDPPETHEPRAA